MRSGGISLVTTYLLYSSLSVSLMWHFKSSKGRGQYMPAESQIANGATGTTAAVGAVGSGLTFAGFIGSYAQVIIISCTVLSLVVALIFHLINSRTNRRRLDLQRADKINEWTKQGKTHEEIKDLLQLARDFR